MKTKVLIPTYVEFVPLTLEEGKLYISLLYGTATHLCPCGCKHRIVTPLGVNGWTLKYNGKISLSPSIGNYHLDCQSHYFICDNQVEWIPSVSTSSKSSRRKKKKVKLKNRFPFVFLC